MNVIVLTPDRVGSTLLQRLITIYMNIHTFDKNVINLHELTNGILKYYSDVFGCEVLGKGNGDEWGYYQTLPEVVELLKSVDHYVTSRLAQYHIKNRKDSIADQLKLYKHINENFFVIAAQRDNLLEHALSWGIVDHSKKLNVYSPEEKLDTYADIYKHRITVEPQNLIKHLNNYKDYLQWVDDHFMVNSYFRYDHHLKDIESYILNLDIFNNQPKRLSWDDSFGIDFKDWNSMHYHVSDFSGINHQLEVNNSDVPKLEYNKDYDVDVNQIQLQPATTKTEKYKSASPALQQFIRRKVKPYWDTYQHINELVDNKILVTPVPRKLQTLLEKKLLIKNYSECVKIYNEWVAKNNIGVPMSEDDLDNLITDELLDYHVKALLPSA